MRKTVCLVGRPNTGKSSLFNRMVMQNKAIISDVAGTTRDRLYGICYHKDKSFNVIEFTLFDHSLDKLIDLINSLALST